MVHETRQQSTPTQERQSGYKNPNATPVHVKRQVLSMILEISGGSDTEVLMRTPDVAGFLACYGDNGPEKLNSLTVTIGRAIEQWLDRNPADFAIG